MFEPGSIPYLFPSRFRFETSELRVMTPRPKLAFIAPVLPTIGAESPTGDEWMHEVKYDGYRALPSSRTAGRASSPAAVMIIEPHAGHRRGARLLPCRSAVLDGEAVILGEDGVSDFFALHACARSPARTSGAARRQTSCISTARSSATADRGAPRPPCRPRRRRGSPYRSDRVKSWVKAVCTIRDSFAVIGAAGSPARALRLARLVEGQLVRCG